MIARLRGEVVEAGAGRLVIDVQGVGYEVQVPETVLMQLGIVGEQITIHTRHIVREDDQSLYGFATQEQRRIFDLLRDVKGCGSRISMSLISTLGEDTMGAIAAQDVRLLTRAPGVGARLAERIVVELKDKAAEFNIVARSTAVIAPLPKRGRKDDELMEALLALGYRRNEAEMAAEEVRSQAEDVETQLKLALQRLAR